ncbi:MAG: type II secretory pathway protein [Firmicutes bacterium]|nr:type II secretory pathway protein [Bacillota bacterium]
MVVIDNAHVLPEPTLQELRLLTNIAMESTCPMALILVDQPPLRDMLRLSCYDHITQRLTVRYHMRGLTAPETREYIAHHLKVAGRTSPLFTPEAIEEIFQYARGGFGKEKCVPVRSWGCCQISRCRALPLSEMKEI